MGFAQASIGTGIKGKNIDSFWFSQNRYHAAIATSLPYKSTVLDLCKVEFITAALIEGLVAHAGQNILDSFWFWVHKWIINFNLLR